MGVCCWGGGGGLLPQKEVNTQYLFITYIYRVSSAHSCIPYTIIGDRGSTVVMVLCYKSEGHWFDSRLCHWNLSLT